MRKIKKILQLIREERSVNGDRFFSCGTHCTHLPIEPLGGGCGEEELATVRVRAGVGHADETRSVVLVFEIFVLEGWAVD